MTSGNPSVTRHSTVIYRLPIRHPIVDHLGTTWHLLGVFEMTICQPMFELSHADLSCDWPISFDAMAPKFPGENGFAVGSRGGTVNISGASVNVYSDLDFLARAGPSDRSRSDARWIGARLWRLRQKPTKAAAGLSSFGLPELAHHSRHSLSSPWIS